MQAFQELIASKRADICYLTTNVVKLEDAPKTYEMIIGRAEPFGGVLIECDFGKEIGSRKIEIGIRQKGRSNPSMVSIGFIGAGSYTQSYLLPNIQRDNDVLLNGVMTRTPVGSRSVADRFGFEFCTTEAEDILANKDINTIFIATRHDSHGRYVIDALRGRKHTCVEKPLCLRLEQLAEIAGLIEREKASNGPLFMVGYH